MYRGLISELLKETSQPFILGIGYMKVNSFIIFLMAPDRSFLCHILLPMFPYVFMDGNETRNYIWVMTNKSKPLIKIEQN